MQILSFDSSGYVVQFAFMQDGQILLERNMAPSERNRQESASSLLPGIDAALKQLGWSKKELDLIVVGVGPGSFTGVRVSVITARSIGQALNLGVLPVSSLECLASAAPRPSCVILPAGSSKYFAAAYDSNEFCSTLMEPFYGGAEEINSRLASLSSVQNILLSPELDQNEFAKDKRKIAYPEGLNFASAALRLAHARLQARPDEFKRDSLCLAYPWDNVLPLYLRSPSVTLKANASSDKTTIGS